MVNSIFENRRAVRKYSNEAISDEKIQEMIAAFQTTVIVAVGKSAVEPEKEDRSKRYQVTIY
ncbi:hypothetical protein [Lactobacillus gallinarum]|uniref:hypothetical protein n=1 Tax=Lactobacillus gallinarum TaxID=52242 RepID=UPI0019588F70|nr:hypothetical protein [Lactobacillus gallinarum]MBM6973617.1 hypothetical protein [Lactobacillus gallinarum]